METSNEIIFEKMQDLDRRDRLLSNFEILSQSFPIELRRRFTGNMMKMFEYKWESEKEKKEAMRRVKALCQAKELGFDNQVVLQCMEAEDILFHDYSNKIVRSGKKADIPVKHLGSISYERDSKPTIRYKGMRWNFNPTEHYRIPLPTQALNYAYELKELGFNWDKSYILEPRIERNVSKDPIFCIAIGRWIISLFRWE